MNCPVPRFLLPPLIICIVLTSVFFIASCGGYDKNGNNQRGNNQLSTSVGDISPLPTPGSARTTYANAQFAYTISYPTQWYLTVSSNYSLVRLFLKYDLSLPEAVAFEMTCFTNSTQLNSLSIWNRTKPPDGSEIGGEMLTFSSGVVAYVAHGQGQFPYSVYTVANERTACQIVTFQTDPFNSQVILATVNSFRWR